MPRTYINPRDGEPLFSIEHGVGTGMRNETKDVRLVQFFLKAALHSQRKLYAAGATHTPPEGAALEMTGIWDEASRRYLVRWEELQQRYAADWHTRGPQFPGTVVPYEKGGMKIIQMNSEIRYMFGNAAHCALTAGGLSLDPEVKADLLWDPLR